MKIEKNDLQEGSFIELLTSLPGREVGSIGEIEEIESIDYEISAIWVYWVDLKKTDRFDLEVEPNILDKIKLKA